MAVVDPNAQAEVLFSERSRVRSETSRRQVVNKVASDLEDGVRGKSG